MYKIIITSFVIISLIRGEDYYEILGISKAASQDEIRKAFKKLAIAYHPDKNNDDPNAQEKFIRITTAYEVLKDDNLRKKYDFYGEDGLNNFHKKQTYYSWSYYDNSFIYEDDQYVISLGKRDYFESVINSDSSWFVNFYSPMCSHCHHLAPIWKKVAKLLDGIVQVAAVNCEYDSQLCYQVGIRAYPTLLYIGKNPQQRIHYTGKRTQEDIIRFVLKRLNIHIPKISKTEWELSLYSKNIIERPTLIFICGFHRNCFTFNERLIVAAIFDKLIDVKLHIYEDCNYYDRISYDTRVVYLPMYNISIWKPVFFNNISDINILIEKLLDQLPGPQELSDNDFEVIKRTEVDVAWLICFYIGNTTNSRINRFSISDVKLGKINCGRNGQFCNKLGVNRYPMWGILKPGGAFELDHGKNTNNNIIKFAQISIKTTNVWALSAEEVLSILQKDNEDIWFLYWYTPLCPSCILLMSEFRSASLKFDKSVIRFGTIDCTVHTMLCRQYNIQYYPTTMLINGNNVHRFNFRTTAANIIQFINEKINSQVRELTSENFHHKLARKESAVLWIVNYFAPWCGSCQRLASEWIIVAGSLSSLPFVNVGSLDCQAEASLCTSQGIRFYPTIRLYPLGSEGLRTVGLYNGKHDSLSILTWITRFFPKKVRNLNPVEYESVLDSKHTWIINFYSGHSQKMEVEFAIAAQLLKKVKFGSVNCELYKIKCGHIKVFPSLILYNSKRKNRPDGVKIAATTAEAIRDKISEIIHSRVKHDEL